MLHNALIIICKSAPSLVLETCKEQVEKCLKNEEIEKIQQKVEEYMKKKNEKKSKEEVQKMSNQE